MEKMNRLEINKVMERYLGSSGGYLGSFDSHPTLLRFYIDCGLDVIPTDYPGTNKARFQAILENAQPADQAKIVRGILKRHPPEAAGPRTQALHDEFLLLAQRLEAGDGVASPSPVYTSEFVRRTLTEVEHAIKTQRETGGVDRIHSALHGYLRHVCDEANIEYVEDDKIIDLFKKLLAEHPALQDLGPRPQDTSTITKSFCAVMSVVDPLRNRTSFAHPTPALLDIPEAMLVINAVRTILHYVDAKLAMA
ncbi:hypothetical protein AYO44_12860 [Planctomycetaceae bacterium SCGC AG-212-F19]|nr:hypothetical protein AYO44_12860 [Planctomycetaceae bacterium SCGC AG-212-F19]